MKMLSAIMPHYKRVHFLQYTVVNIMITIDFFFCVWSLNLAGAGSYVIICTVILTSSQLM